MDEEIGLLGAGSLDVSPLKGRRMLNMDSEAEGIFTVSCAGGNNTISLLPLTRVPFAGTALQVTVGGLTGGHSGNEIDKGRANANMLMGRVLQDLAGRTDLRLADVHGGLKSNTIPVESTATIVVADAAAARTGVAEMEETLRNEYHITDPALFLKVEDAALADTPMDAATTSKAICLLTCLPNGIQAMSPSIEGLVQTSLNLGIHPHHRSRYARCVRFPVCAVRWIPRKRCSSAGWPRCWPSWAVMWSTRVSTPAGSTRSTLPCGS